MLLFSLWSYYLYTQSGIASMLHAAGHEQVHFC